MTFLADNWSLIVALIFVFFFFLYSGKQSVMKWLLYAVSMAEEEFGSGTGKLKLLQCYSSFVAIYPIFSKVIPFSIFSKWVDIVLVEMREMLEKNANIKKIVEGE